MVSLANRGERRAERHIGRGRQAGLVEHGAKAGVAAVVHQRLHAPRRQLGELGERILEHPHVARQERAQHQPGIELAAGTQMADQRAGIVVGAERPRW